MPLGGNGLCGYRMSSVSLSAGGDADIEAFSFCCIMKIFSAKQVPLLCKVLQVCAASVLEHGARGSTGKAAECLPKS